MARTCFSMGDFWARCRRRAECFIITLVTNAEYLARRP